MYKVGKFMQKWAIRANSTIHFFAQSTPDEKGLSEHLSEMQVSLKFVSVKLRLVLDILQYGTFFLLSSQEIWLILPEQTEMK